MKILAAASLAFSLFAGAAIAETSAEVELHPLCESIGEFTVAAFEARSNGLAHEEAMTIADDEEDADAKELLTAVVDAVYATELSKNDDEATEQMVNLTAELMIACQEGTEES